MVVSCKLRLQGAHHPTRLLLFLFYFIEARVGFPRMKGKFNESNFLNLIHSRKRVNCTVENLGKKFEQKKIQNRKKIHRFKNTLYIKNGAFPGAKLIYLKGKPKWTCEKTHMDPCSKCKTTMYGKCTSQNWWNVSNRQESNFSVPRQQSTKSIRVNAILSKDYPRYGVFNECFLIVAILIKLKYSYIVNPCYNHTINTLEAFHRKVICRAHISSKSW